MKLCQLLIFPELLLVEFEPFAPHFEKVEYSHLVDKLCGVVGIEENVLTDLASLQVLSNKFIIGSFLFTLIFIPILFLLNLNILFRRSIVIKGDRKIYLFVEDLVNSFFIVVDDV